MDPSQVAILERLATTPATPEIIDPLVCDVCGLHLVRHCSGWTCPDTSLAHRRRTKRLALSF